VRTDDVGVIADGMVALHSSDPATVYLSAGLRMVTPSIDAIGQALHTDRRIVRHHAFRRTLWVMTPEVAREAHGAATAKIGAVERRKLLEILSTDPTIDDAEAWYRSAVASIRRLLTEEGPLSTREIGRHLPELTRRVTIGVGTRNPAEVAAHTRVLLVAGFGGELVRTAPTHGWNTAEYRWSDTTAWLGQPLVGAPQRDSTARILARWLSTFGPATETDIRWWTGWTATQMRRALDDIGAEPVRLDDDRQGWVDGGDVDAPDVDPWVALLPGLDPTTMGWKERTWYLDETARGRSFDRWGNAGPTIWMDGVVVGGWAQRADGTVSYELFNELRTGQRALLDDAIDRFTALVGSTRIRPRFPSPNQPDLLMPSAR
jgi:hypothetical protein